MVTSALPGEGKSTLARELVYAFLDVGAKAILVECDLRRPTLGDKYRVVDGGLTPWLAGLTQDPPVIHETEDGLSMIVAGPRAPNPVALLQSDRLKRFLTELAASQRFVVIDAPPVLGVADARLLASLADGVVLTARAGRSQGPLVRAARMSLASAGANILGTVLNATEPDLVTAYLGEHYYA
jgi:capsular exopolysaccharide synthesis family protein